MTKAKTKKMVDDLKFVKLLMFVKQSQERQIVEHTFTVMVPVDVRISFESALYETEICVEDVDTDVYSEASCIVESLPEVIKMQNRLQSLEEDISEIASALEAKYYSEDDEWCTDDIVELAINIVVEVQEREPSARKYKRKYPTVFGKQKK